MRHRSRQLPGRRAGPSARQRHTEPASVIRRLSLEALEQRRLLIADFGDAPEPYPTLQEFDGAQHLAHGPRLGALRDTEDDGQPTIGADGDDNAGENDEDGVTLSVLTTGQLGASIAVDVQNAPDGARLNAWIDFDSDGSWGGPSEHVADGVAVDAGPNAVAFAVPSWATDGSHAARFRIATTDDLGAFGLAGDGEVEDHLVTITEAVPAADVFGSRKTISDSADGASSVATADVDGDGDLDVLSASFEDDTIAWYENDGSQGFTLHVISDTADGASCVATADVDGDGDLDVLSASFEDDTIAWYENDGSQGFTLRVISDTADGASSVLAVDLDADGDRDILATSFEGDSVSWYENDSGQQFTAHTVHSEADGARGVFAADVNRDGFLDVLSASSEDGSIAWYANDGSQSFTAHVISDAVAGASSLFTTDLDRDGDTDVLATSADDDTITWYEYDSDAEDEDQAFVAHPVSAQAAGANGVVAADFDGDGDTDLLASSATDNTIAWYENDGSQQFAHHPISEAAAGATALVVADLDGDGDLDVISASADDDTISWYPHNATPTIGILTDVTIEEDAADPTVDLLGITAGGRENQPLQVTASSDNPELILDPEIDYNSPDQTGTLHFPPVADAHGVAAITVTVTDGGPDLDLQTAADNASVSRTFTVTVTAVNDVPTLAALDDRSIQEDADTQSVNLSGITAGGGEDQPLRVTASSDNTALIDDPAVAYTSDDETGSLAFIPLADQSGTALITVIVEDGGLDKDLITTNDNATTLQTFTVTVNATPTLDAIEDLTLDEDADEQSADLSGITAGSGEDQPLQVTASSDNTGLVEDPKVTYSSDDALGNLTFAPLADQSGAATITVTVEDGGPDEDLATHADNGIFSQTFEVTVAAVNDPPTLGAIDGVAVDEDADEQSVDLDGITAGGGEDQTLRVTASSDNTDLIEDPGVTYSTDDLTGSLTFTPLADQSGTATITVTVEDAGLDGDLVTATDNASFSRTFEVAVTAVNDTPTLDGLDDLTIDEGAGQQTVDLTGITAGGGEDQTLQVTASSDQPDLIEDPAVTYTSAQQTGSLTFQPLAAQSGTATITVTVKDGGLDGDLETVTDNASFSEAFEVIIESTNRAPAAADDAYTGVENVTLVIAAPGVLDNDSDQDDDSLTAVLVDSTSHGALSLSADGSFTYEPDEDFNRTDSFSYKATDAEDESDTTTVTITLTTDFPWYNGRLPMDVNDDGSIAPNDAIAGVSSINRDGTRVLPTPREEGVVAPFYDVNRDGALAPNDVLTVVNFLNSRSASGEGEATRSPTSVTLFALLEWPTHTPQAESLFAAPTAADRASRDSDEPRPPPGKSPRRGLYELNSLNRAQTARPSYLWALDSWFATLGEDDPSDFDVPEWLPDATRPSFRRPAW